MLDSRIKFEERSDSTVRNITNLYFIAPKEMLGNKYPEAESMEICITVPSDSLAANSAFVTCSPTKFDDKLQCHVDYDWSDIEMSMEDITELLLLAHIDR